MTKRYELPLGSPMMLLSSSIDVASALFPWVVEDGLILPLDPVRDSLILALVGFAAGFSLVSIYINAISQSSLLTSIVFFPSLLFSIISVVLVKPLTLGKQLQMISVIMKLLTLALIYRGFGGIVIEVLD